MAETRGVLNDVAHAISNVARIYAQDPESGSPVEIPAAELLDARFLRGAHLLMTKRGKEYRGLTVQRRDLNEAILILKRVGFAIKPASAQTS